MFDKDQYLKEIKESHDYLLEKGFKNIDIAIILGSGLNEIAEDFEQLIVANYSDIPNFAKTTVEGHKGRMILCKYNRLNVLFMQGRFHYYEGYPMYRVVFPIRVLSLLGVRNLIVTNAAGGINPNFNVGDIMIITDHIALFIPENPLRGPNLDDFGTRFPNMQKAYDYQWIMRVKSKLTDMRNIKEGVYCMVPGPNYETPAEVKMLRIIGADAVGMSTVPEVIVAKHCNIKVIGFSIITNIYRDFVESSVTHKEVLENTKKSLDIMKKIIQASLETVYG